MRLLFLNHNLREHGTYFRALHLGRELAAMGHEVTLLTASPDHWYRPVRDTVDGVEVIETPSWNPFFNRDDGFSPLDALYRAGLVIRRRWDALYAFAHPPNVLVPYWVFRAVRRGSVVVDWCDLYGGGGGIVARRRRLWEEEPSRRPPGVFARTAQRLAWMVEPRAEQHMARHAPKLTVISSFLYRQALHIGVSPQRVLRLSSGAPVDAIRPFEKRICREQLEIDAAPGQAVLVYVANYHPDEDFLLRALKAACDQLGEGGGDTTVGAGCFKVFVVGPPFTAGKLSDFNLSEDVYEVGRRPFSEMAPWLGAADLLLLPYPDTVFNRSRWPNKIGDYLAAGRPIVTNQTGDFRPLFRRFDIGMASEGTPEAYGRAIAEAVRARDRWEPWGAAARRVAEGPLSWKRLARRLARFWLNESQGSV